MEEIMEALNKIEKRLQNSTYCPVSRQEFLRIYKHGLTEKSFELFLIMRFAAIDWKGSETRGQIKTTIRKLKEFLKWSQGDISRRVKELQEAGLIKLLKHGLWLVSLDGSPLPDFIKKSEPEAGRNRHNHSMVETKTQKQDSLSHSGGTPCPTQAGQTKKKFVRGVGQDSLKTQELLKELLKEEEEREAIKKKESDFQKKIDIHRIKKEVEEEYQKIFTGANGKKLTVKDYQWLDKNVKEETTRG